MAAHQNQEKKMVVEPPPFKLQKPTLPDDATDMEALWSDPLLGDGITDENMSTPVGKPPGFFRTHPYRWRAEVSEASA
jgi:hypothetical protein